MQAPGLYFPFVHVRDDNWLKAAALYWPAIHRIVPQGYGTHDSPTAQTFWDAGILRDEDPTALTGLAEWDLAQALERNARRLTERFSITEAIRRPMPRPWAEPPGQPWEVEALAWIHITKFPGHVVDQLAGQGLAVRGRHTMRLLDPGEPEEWIGLHPALAGAYMKALASQLSRPNGLEPMTDQVDLRVAAPSSGVHAALELLMLDEGEHTQAGGPRDSDLQTYMMLAFQHVQPRDLSTVPAEKIVECRDILADELGQFRDYIDTFRDELAQLSSISNDQRRLEEFTRHVESRIEAPLRALERGLALHRLDATRALICTGATAPGLAAGLAGAPAAVSVTGGAAIALGAAWWQVAASRQAVKDSSPVTYLLDVREHLTPQSIAGRMRKVLRGSSSTR